MSEVARTRGPAAGRTDHVDHRQHLSHRHGQRPLPALDAPAGGEAALRRGIRPGVGKAGAPAGRQHSAHYALNKRTLTLGGK